MNSNPWIFVIGITPGGLGSLSLKAHNILKKVDVIFGCERCISYLSDEEFPARKLVWGIPFDPKIDDMKALSKSKVAVLATGDPMYYGIGKTIIKHFDFEEICILPAPSAFSLACTRLGWSMEDINTLSLHGTCLSRSPAKLVPLLYPKSKIIILPKDNNTPAEVARLLCEHGYKTAKMTALSCLEDDKNETIASSEAQNWTSKQDVNVHSFHVLAIDCLIESGQAIHSPAPGNENAVFQGDNVLTKSQIRSLTISNLKPFPGALLWDIGSGCGSIAIEWMRCAKNAKAISIEKNMTRVEYIKVNSMNLGVPDLKIITGLAVDILPSLPVPNAIFIGGGICEELIDYCVATLKNSCGYLVTNAVTLESESIVLGMQRKYGGSLNRINIHENKGLGDYTIWSALNPVTQWVLRVN